MRLTLFIGILLLCGGFDGKPADTTCGVTATHEHWKKAPFTGNTVATRFAPPPSFQRVEQPAGSFGAWLRALPLKPEGSPVLLFNGRQKQRAVHAAVIDMEIGTQDLQQCADAVMRLRAEWLRAQGRADETSFDLTDGFRAEYRRWRRGERIGVRPSGTAYWKSGGAADSSYKSFRQYLDVVFTYAGTLSLAKTLKPKAAKDLLPGDVFIRGGSPGHAVIVLDVIQNAKGEKRFLIAQSYMPAQDIHILKNFKDPALSPWYDAHLNGYLETPEWDFYEKELKTW